LKVLGEERLDALLAGLANNGSRKVARIIAVINASKVIVIRQLTRHIPQAGDILILVQSKNVDSVTIPTKLSTIKEFTIPSISLVLSFQ